MDRCRKKDILGLIVTMMEANDAMFAWDRKKPQGLAEMLVQCQEAAMQIGASLETAGDHYASIIGLLEDYCENIYQMSISFSDENGCRKLAKKIRKQLTNLQNRIRYEMPDDKKEVVFLPYKASMWDSLESVWKAANADENTDAYVIPIPYYDKNPDGSFREEHYEGDLYPAYVPITKYDEYDFASRRPDAIYIHNAYDDCNYVTSVHPFFYSKNLKKFTDKLVYIPYFVLGEVRQEDKAAVDGMKHFCVVPGVFHADKVVVQSKEMRQVYINVLTEETLKNQSCGNEKAIRKYWEEKVDGSGSPKVDKILGMRRENLKIPEEWMKVIRKPDGKRKTIILYNTTVTALLQHNEQYLVKLRDVLRFFYECQDEVSLLWRPHPLFVSTIESMRPMLGEEYQDIVEEYRRAKWGIYDDTSDIDRAIVMSDAYYGDGSSVVQMCQVVGKPVMIQDPNVIGAYDGTDLKGGSALYSQLPKNLISKKEKMAVIGLGYVGMPIAVAFAQKYDVIGFDLNSEKIRLYRSGIDPTKEVGDAVIRNTTVDFSEDEKQLRKARFHIVAVPTPVNVDHTPDLRPIESASEILGRNLSKGSVVVYESTVYPGVTEEVCIPILEKVSGLRCGRDFKVGYSPERINPGDKEHRLESITKIVSGIDQETLNVVAEVYETVIKAGVHRAESIKVAEAAKVIENSQRDINIAFMNELSIIFNRMGIDTKSVLEAAGTKWNFLKFTPGLVGGHCIGVDPYYLTYKAEMLGYHSQIILSGRRINDDMGKYVAEMCVKLLVGADKPVKNAKVAIFGFTFKENCPDTRNTKVVDIVKELGEYGIFPLIFDPVADRQEARALYGVDFAHWQEMNLLDAVIFAVSHDMFRTMEMNEINGMFGKEKKVLLDLKGIFDRKEYEGNGYTYWRL